VYFGLYAPNRGAVATKLKDPRWSVQDKDGMFSFPTTSPLHPLFLGQRNKAPTDQPEHFAHQNSATRLSALWVRDSPSLRQVLKGLRVPLTPTSACGVLGVKRVIRASLPEGDLYLLPSATETVVAARVEVRSISEVEAVLKANGFPENQ